MKVILKSSPFYGKKSWNEVGAREAYVWNGGGHSEKGLFLETPPSLVYCRTNTKPPFFRNSLLFYGSVVS